MNVEQVDSPPQNFDDERNLSIDRSLERILLAVRISAQRKDLRVTGAMSEEQEGMFDDMLSFLMNDALNELQCVKDEAA